MRGNDYTVALILLLAAALTWTALSNDCANKRCAVPGLQPQLQVDGCVCVEIPK